MNIKFLIHFYQLDLLLHFVNVKLQNQLCNFILNPYLKFSRKAVLAQLGERQTEEFENFGQLKLSGGPVFDPQKSHLFFAFVCLNHIVCIPFQYVILRNIPFNIQHFNIL